VTAHATLAQQRRLLAAAVEISTTRYATATAPQSDPLQARVALARLDTEEADLVAQEAKLRAELKALRQVTGTDQLRIEPLRPDAVPAGLHAQGDSSLAAVPDSLADHPRVTARRAAVEAAEQTARVEQLAARPDFTVTGRYAARPLGSDFFSAFVGVRLPLWSGRKQGRLADAARAEADAARAAEDEETTALNTDLRSTLADVQSGATRLHLLTSQIIPAAQATVDATLRGYRVGQVEFLNVLAAEDSLYRAELDAALVAAEHLTHFVMLQQLLSREDVR